MQRASVKAKNYEVAGLLIGLQLTSSLIYSSTRPSTLTSTWVSVNTGHVLIQAASDEEEAVGQRTWGPKGHDFFTSDFMNDFTY